MTTRTTRSALKKARLFAESTARVVTYNVLSSHLAAPSWFTSCKPENLDQATRLTKVQNKLKPEIEQQSIICLQEISTTWVGPLHRFFSAHGYHFITALYGNKRNGYMGVAMAVPTSKYDIKDVDITCIADTKRMPRVAYKPPTLFTNMWKAISSWVVGLMIYWKFYKPPLDIWDNTLYRKNQMICARLEHKEQEEEFVVGTYHMPCMFELTPVMMAHCALSSQHIQKYANDLPFIYTGDFNVKPHTPEYKLLTEGKIDSSDPAYPTPVAGDDWKPDLAIPMKSAYAVKEGKEPDFTNYAKVQENPVFIDTLDYFFYSLPLPHRDTVPGPLPNDEEPSDHIMLAATFAFDNNNGPSSEE
eukprot:CAMPEP_0173161836 /NCGR_PEP_ID=MMETSP1105-20130129/18862_1 /TAXON_ID=2985 /ORGANISM="Ochromonas sp., Strain BG-1" /LENGTH=358 /DNA_ID=CAMNT_0014081377 /DNA_START=45 /DNA_END=1121 /DNA_ORIENTATION=+